MNDRILFLDIDGVLNSKIFYKYIYKPEDGGSRFDSYCVVLVKRLVEEFSLKIVISSTWRNGVVNKLMKELTEHRLIDYLHEDWHTPVLRSASRGEEIKLWLDNHPEVHNYIILDDNENILDDQLSRFIKTSTNSGMVQERYHEARNLLLSYDQVNALTEMAIEN